MRIRMKTIFCTIDDFILRFSVRSTKEKIMRINAQESKSIALYFILYYVTE